MKSPVELPVDSVLAAPEAPLDRPPGRLLGRSREGRPIHGLVIGHGSLRVSLIGGCHADEPVGPAMLRRLAGYLLGLPPEAPQLAGATWHLVPHVNPDGEAANASWARLTHPLEDHRGSADRGYDLLTYLDRVVREPPGDDIEFGFPRDDADDGARPENRAVAGFLAADAPFDLHVSFHGMGFAAGPWFLLERAWIERTADLRRTLGQRVGAMGYRLHDVDRQGEKGFTRIAHGFTTRPDSAAMAEYFRQRGDDATAALFRPSSMETVRRLGGDPLTLVSEMPLFLLPATPADGDGAPPSPSGTEGRKRFHAWAGERLAAGSSRALRGELATRGFRPMPIGDQMRLQIAFLNAGLAAVHAHRNDL